MEGGETVVELVNSGFLEGVASDDEYDGVDSGWKKSLAILKHYLENYRGRRRSAVLSIVPAAFEYDTLRPLFTTAEGLSKWLASFATVGKRIFRPGPTPRSLGWSTHCRAERASRASSLAAQSKI
jgi:hypothetical protein